MILWISAFQKNLALIFFEWLRTDQVGSNYNLNTLLPRSLPAVNKCFFNLPDTLPDLYLTLASIWAIFVCTVGFLGNLLTLMAISLAAKQKRFVMSKIFYLISSSHFWNHNSSKFTILLWIFGPNPTNNDVCWPTEVNLKQPLQKYYHFLTHN